jgi:hypothetical protein
MASGGLVDHVGQPQAPVIGGLVELESMAQTWVGVLGPASLGGLGMQAAALGAALAAAHALGALQPMRALGIERPALAHEDVMGPAPAPAEVARAIWRGRRRSVAFIVHEAAGKSQWIEHPPPPR